MSGFGTETTEGGNQFSVVGLTAALGNNLVSMLTAEDIAPGSRPSYQMCKTIYLYHPLGAKLVEAPIRLAQSQKREISVPAGPESKLIPEFEREWATIGGRDVNGSDVSATTIIRNLVVTSKIYGIASLVVGERGKDNTQNPIKLEEIADSELFFNVLDPLNTAGSLVLDQDPTSPDFQKARSVQIGGRVYHPSRTVIMMNEQPIYIEFTSSAFGFVGRSVYQRALYPLKTFLQTMITDQYVAIKVGLLIASMKAPGSVINNVVQKFFGAKRQQLQGGMTGNVLGIGIDEKIESLNFQNLEGPAAMVRNNALKNVAMAAGQPSKLIEMETMVGGMAEGTEDAKQIAHYIDGQREETDPVYRFMDRLVMRRAWSPEFYKTVQKEDQSYKSMPYETAFMQWMNSFQAKWPNLLEEPDSEKMRTEEIKFKSLVALYEVLAPDLDPENKAEFTGFVVDNINKRNELFTGQLDIDVAKLKKHAKDMQQQAKDAAMNAGGAGGADGKEPSKPKPFASTT